MTSIGYQPKNKRVLIIIDVVKTKTQIKITCVLVQHFKNYIFFNVK